MRVITPKRIKEFVRVYPDAEISLQQWYKITSKSDWSAFNDIKNTFNSVDYVGNNRFVFNIKGNHYRFIGTHKEYDKISNIKNI